MRRFFARAVILVALLAGRSTLALAQEDVEPARFHHVRLNVTDPQKTVS